MAWEDRTPAEQAQADQEAGAYRNSDDDVLYIVTTGKGTRLVVQGRNSAQVAAGLGGRVETEGWGG